MRNIVIASALAAVSLAATSAPALGETRSVSVSFADLNLDTAAGMAALDGRLRAATQRVCGAPVVRSARDSLDQQSCVRSTRASVAIEIARVSGNRAVLALNDVRR